MSVLRPSITNHLVFFHQYLASKASGNQEHKVFRKAQKRPAPRDSGDEDDEDLMDDIVGMLTSGNLPIETVENKVK